MHVCQHVFLYVSVFSSCDLRSMSVCVYDGVSVYSVVVSTWCASLMCETSAMTVEPSAPKGEIECKCVCVRIFSCVHEHVCVVQKCVCLCALVRDYLTEPTTCLYFFVHMGHHEVLRLVTEQKYSKQFKVLL